MSESAVYQLRVDVTAEQLHVTLTRNGERLPFPASLQQCVAYAVMAVTRTSADPERLVSAEMLHRYRPFSSASLHTLRNGFGSLHVGKALGSHHARDLIYSTAVTKAWRLNLPPSQICFRPDRDAVCCHLEYRKSREPDAATDFLHWARLQLRALLANDYEESLPGVDPFAAAQEALQAAAGRRDWELLARHQWARTQIRVGAGELASAAEALQALIDQSAEHAGLAASLRLRAIGMACQARRADIEHLPELVTQLRGAIDTAKERGDLASASQLLNGLGVMLVRLAAEKDSGKAIILRNEARSAYQEALTLQLLCRDTLLLQGICHNMATLEAAPTLNDRMVAGELQIQQLELALFLAHALKVHSSSCATECHLAVLLASVGRFDEAEQHLATAEKLLSGIDNRSEHAHYAFARAHLAWWRHDLQGQDPQRRMIALDELKRANRDYQAEGDFGWANTVTRQIEMLKRQRSKRVDGAENR